MERPGSQDSVADAMNRVLDAERETAAAVAAATGEAEATLEAAREQRRRVLDNARRRATRLHVRALERLELQLAALANSTTFPGADTSAAADQAAEAARKVAAQLTALDATESAGP